jgi:hypothetical protein
VVGERGEQGTFSTAGGDGDPLAPMEELVLHDGLMDLIFENAVEAVLADHLGRLGPLDDGPVLRAEATVPHHLSAP